MSAAGQESSISSVTDLSHPQPWSLSRWTLCVGLVFAAHIGFIFAFSDRKPITPRSVVNAPRIQFMETRSELLVLDDPTLFALPHARGFAAASWLRLPQIDFAPFRWTEPPQLLDLPVAKLGNIFLRFAESNAAPKLELDALPPARPSHWEAAESSTSLRQHSTVSANGNLAKRPWLNAPALLRSWPATDLLTNSVVRVVVDPNGEVFSSVMLPPGSGSKAADQYALEIARSAKFAPLPRRTARQVIGTLSFEWHTVPAAETNSPPTQP